MSREHLLPENQRRRGQQTRRVNLALKLGQLLDAIADQLAVHGHSRRREEATAKAATRLAEQLSRCVRPERDHGP